MTPTPRTQIVDWAREIYEDLDFTVVRKWLDGNPERKAAGFLPVYAPKEVIHAAGMLPVGIHGNGAIEIIRGDAYYQSYICHLPRSVVELAESGRLDFLSAALFPSTCDVIRNLSGMWQIMFPEMYVRYLDLPQVADPILGAKFWQRELNVIRQELARVAGVKVDDECLRASVAVYNEVREVIEQLYGLRNKQPWKVPTEELYLLLRAGELVAPEVFMDKARTYLQAAENSDERLKDRTRVIIVGSFCEQPPLGLIKTIERAGCYIVDDDFLAGNRFLSAAVPTAGDPVANLATTFTSSAIKTSVLYEPEPDGKKKLMQQRAAAAGADGIIFCAASFCDPALLDRPMLREGAERAGIPCIAFKFAENSGQFQQFREQAGTFSDSIKLWGDDMSDRKVKNIRNAQKDDSMIIQKEMIAEHYKRLERAPETKEPVVYTFVPGNLTELIRSFGCLPVLPEINALQSGMRGKSRDYIAEAEKHGHSEDVCTYVKCDIGMAMAGNIGPTGTKLPKPDLLLLSYTGCYTFMKWFELLREQYDCPCVFLHVPYQGDGNIEPEHRQYMVQQIKDEVIPALEKISGRKYDEDGLKERLRLSVQAEDELVWVLQSAMHKPSPIDAYFGAVYYVGPIFSAFRGTEEGVKYYQALRREVQSRLDAGLGPVAPQGPMAEEKYRLVVEGPPNWTHFREFWQMFADEGAVVVASTYSKVGGTYDFGFRHNPDDPLGTMGDYCAGCYTNHNLPGRIDMLCQYLQDYEADGFLINSVKSCNSFSAGQLMILREVEKRTGLPGGFIESDLVDPRYFSAANIKNRLESYLQMVEARRRGAAQKGLSA